MSIQAVAWALERYDGMRSSQRLRLWNMTDGRCYYCGCEFLRDSEMLGCNSGDERRLCVDHVIPKISGGKGLRNNTVPSCRSCNSTKRALSIDAFRKRLTLRKHGIPEFTTEQSEWLFSQGFVMPEVTDISFYGERK